MKCSQCTNINEVLYSSSNCLYHPHTEFYFNSTSIPTRCQSYERFATVVCLYPHTAQPTHQAAPHNNTVILSQA
ncbi:hypothetical protein E2C01_012394 [Portunus trituberculatus]|uniref:Uncharacterized protein n=1 Tax=Portunus trituberculatus TaxID=210409 RepID=A0A5B7DE19_PORTR|nr:hypothetical protein [Portunus trituberculatus]